MLLLVERAWAPCARGGAAACQLDTQGAGKGGLMFSATVSYLLLHGARTPIFHRRVRPAREVIAIDLSQRERLYVARLFGLV